MALPEIRPLSGGLAAILEERRRREEDKAEKERKKKERADAIGNILDEAFGKKK